MQLTINGAQREVDIDPSTPAVFALRNDLGCRDVRLGCGEGACSACVVLVDGRPSTTCDTAIEAFAGKEIRTVSGFGSADAPHPVQMAFLEHQAAQCGYCLSGILASAVALYERSAIPDDEEIRAAMDRHLCRCGAQHRMLEAIRSALRTRDAA
jgi:nicotinate dehydrogenase subunit A